VAPQNHKSLLQNIVSFIGLFCKSETTTRLSETTERMSQIVIRIFLEISIYTCIHVYICICIHTYI